MTKNTNKRTYMTHSFIDVQIYFILCVIVLIVAVKAQLAGENETAAHWPICWCCLDRGPGSFYVEDATTLSWYES